MLQDGYKDVNGTCEPFTLDSCPECDTKEKESSSKGLNKAEKIALVVGGSGGKHNSVYLH